MTHQFHIVEKLRGKRANANLAVFHLFIVYRDIRPIKKRPARHIVVKHAESVSIF